MTWKELKSFTDSLNEKQLNEQVIMLREDSTIDEISTRQMESDFYTHPEHDEHESFTLKQNEGYGYPKGELTKVCGKGAPFLVENF